MHYDLAEAIFAAPNCTTVFCNNAPPTGITVRMGRIMDGFSENMKDYDEKDTFVPRNEPEPSKEDVVSVLKESGAKILSNYLPMGSEDAYYMTEAFINDTYGEL